MVLSWVLDQSKPLNAAQQTSMVAVFLGLNLSLNMMGKYVLGTRGFHYAAAVTICHLAFGFFVVLPGMLSTRFRGMHRTAITRQWKGLLAVGSFIGLNIVLNNLSLVYIELTLVQIIRSGIPIFTSLLGIVVEKKVPSRVEMVGILVLTAGVVTCLYEGSSVEGSITGIVLCLASTLCGAAMLSFSGAVLDQTEKMDAVRLNFYCAPVAVAVLIPAFLSLEARSLKVWWDTHPHDIIAYVLAGGLIAVLYNIVHSLVIQRTSSVTTPVIGMIKVVAIIVLSALLLGERDIFSVRMTTGCVLSILGGFLYSRAKSGTAKGNTQKTVPITSSPQWGTPHSKSGVSGILKDAALIHGRREQSPSRRRPDFSV